MTTQEVKTEQQSLCLRALTFREFQYFHWKSSEVDHCIYTQKQKDVSSSHDKHFKKTARKHLLTQPRDPARWLWALPAPLISRFSSWCRWAWWPRCGRCRCRSSRGSWPPSPRRCRRGARSAPSPPAGCPSRPGRRGGWPSPRRRSSRCGLPEGQSRWLWRGGCPPEAARCPWSRACPRKCASGLSGGPGAAAPWHLRERDRHKHLTRSLEMQNLSLSFPNLDFTRELHSKASNVKLLTMPLLVFLCLHRKFSGRFLSQNVSCCTCSLSMSFPPNYWNRYAATMLLFYANQQMTCNLLDEKSIMQIIYGLLLLVRGQLWQTSCMFQQPQ